jgi:hypothetical protein
MNPMPVAGRDICFPSDGYFPFVHTSNSSNSFFNSGEAIMGIEYAVNSGSRRHHSGASCDPPSDPRQIQTLKLGALLEAIERDDLEHARQAFVALVNFSPSVENDPLLTKVGSALQSSNLHAAKYFAKDLHQAERPLFAARLWR